jgi:hypothetical protein
MCLKCHGAFWRLAERTDGRAAVFVETRCAALCGANSIATSKKGGRALAIDPAQTCDVDNSVKRNQHHVRKIIDICARAWRSAR